MITEGENEEVEILENINDHFFSGSKSKVFILNYKTNIYGLFKQLKDDDFDTDIIEILKEKNKVGEGESVDGIDINEITRNNISETYLFFDYDGHHYGSHKNPDIVDTIMKEMLDYFDDETTPGKLYISYPMVEALCHIKTEDNQAKMVIRCFPARKGKIGKKHYKQISKSNSDYKKYLDYKREDWIYLINYALKVTNYLCCQSIKSVEYKSFSKNLDPIYIFDNQIKHFIEVSEEIVILSAFPLFLLSYFGEKLYTECTTQESTEFVVVNS